MFHYFNYGGHVSMINLNLVNQELSTIKYTITTFPDGEPHITLEGDLTKYKHIGIQCRICNPNDLFILMQVANILKNNSIPIKNIVIFYLMSMRMDRPMSSNRAFSLQIVADVINSFNAQRVVVLEPHSKETMKLINNCDDARSNELYSIADNYTLVFPDSGASSRYFLLSDEAPINCRKVRDAETGELSGFSVDLVDYFRSEKTPGSKPFLIVDDLCDGGGTFLGVLEALKKAFKKCMPEFEPVVDIVITHMVNPKGIKNLSENFRTVYFTNSYKDWDISSYDNVTMIKII